MTKKIIQATDQPRTQQTLADDLRSLGVQAGMSVLVHSSPSQLGWVNGGVTAVLYGKPTLILI